MVGEFVAEEVVVLDVVDEVVLVVVVLDVVVVCIVRVNERTEA